MEKFIEFKSGCFRHYLMIGEIVIKFPKVWPIKVIPRNFITMTSEVMIYLAKGRPKDYCPIYFSLPPLLTIMPRCQKSQEGKDYGLYRGKLVCLDYSRGTELAAIPQRFIFSLKRCLESYLKLEYFKRENILIINIRNIHVRIGITKGGRKANRSELKYCQNDPTNEILRVRYSALFGLLNIYPRYNPFPDDKILRSGQLITHIAPTIRCKIRKPYRAYDFGFLKGRFIITKYDYL